jgi:glycosyltransferase involved in cell wall biosynthesis
MKKLVVASNMKNERPQLEAWFSWVKQIADGGILIVDTGSTDGTVEFAQQQGAIVVTDDIIIREGYGPARNHLRELAKKYFSDAHWFAYFDADESISEEEFHILRWTKDYLIPEYDVVAFPRIDWFDRNKEKAANDFRYAPDWQARMTQLNSPLTYVRRLHEQIHNFKAIYCNLMTPKINHFHRALPGKRDAIGKLCAYLHAKDEYGNTYPEHPKEAYYRELYQKEGL